MLHVDLFSKRRYQVKFKHFMVLHFLAVLGRGTVTKNVLVSKASAINFSIYVSFSEIISGAIITQSLSLEAKSVFGREYQRSC